VIEPNRDHDEAPPRRQPALRQDLIGHQLQSALRDDETAWLDAELG
jgi:hypothetical protein